MGYNKEDLLCFKCMSTLEVPGQRCPNCGFDNRFRDNSAGYLPAMVLQNQYFVGMAMGRGGFGITYIGYDLVNNRQVAIKEYFSAQAKRAMDNITVTPYDIEAAEDFNKGFVRAVEEAGMMALAKGVPNTVQVYNTFSANGTMYIVMEYIHGTTIAKIVETRGKMSWRSAKIFEKSQYKSRSKGRLLRGEKPNRVLMCVLHNKQKP